jgi:hypothetical protein
MNHARLRLAGPSPCSVEGGPFVAAVAAAGAHGSYMQASQCARMSAGVAGRAESPRAHTFAATAAATDALTVRMALRGG